VRSPECVGIFDLAGEPQATVPLLNSGKRAQEGGDFAARRQTWNTLCDEINVVFCLFLREGILAAETDMKARCHIELNIVSRCQPCVPDAKAEERYFWNNIEHNNRFSSWTAMSILRELSRLA